MYIKLSDNQSIIYGNASKSNHPSLSSHITHIKYTRIVTKINAQCSPRAKRWLPKPLLIAKVYEFTSLQQVINKKQGRKTYRIVQHVMVGWLDHFVV